MRCNILNDDIKPEDLKRIEKMTNIIAQLQNEATVNGVSFIELLIMQINLVDLFQVL
jgi:hypothetical protein